jgi:hypothetical protein
MAKVRKHRLKKATKCACLKGWICEDHPNKPWGIKVAELPGNCARIRSATKILTLFFYLYIVRCSQAKGNRQLEKLHSYEVNDILNFFREGVAFPQSAEVGAGAGLLAVT